MSATKTARGALLAQVHMAKADLKLPEEAYRDVLEQATGRRSAAQCSDAQLRMAVNAMERYGWKGRSARGRGNNLPTNPQARLAWALWQALYHMGEIDLPSEAALDAFARQRVTGLGALRWHDQQALSKVIEALKARCARAGYEVPPPSGDKGRSAKIALARAIWARLHEAGAVRIASTAALDGWLQGRLRPHATALELLDTKELDQVAQDLGDWLRKTRSKP